MDGHQVVALPTAGALTLQGLAELGAISPNIVLPAGIAHWNRRAQERAARDLIAALCIIEQVRLSDVMSDDQCDFVVHARRRMIAAVAEAFPHFSLPRIGQLFNRNHSTIVNAIAAHVAFEGKPLRKWTVEKARARMAERAVRQREYKRRQVARQQVSNGGG